jgi:hypothetical protein
MADSFFDVFFDATPGRLYRIQGGSRLDSFFDIWTELSFDGEEGMATLPGLGPQGFYRIQLDPE